MLPFYECLPEGQLGPLQHEQDFDVSKASHCAVHHDLNAAAPLGIIVPCQQSSERCFVWGPVASADEWWSACLDSLQHLGACCNIASALS